MIFRRYQSTSGEKLIPSEDHTLFFAYLVSSLPEKLVIILALEDSNPLSLEERIERWKTRLNQELISLHPNQSVLKLLRVVSLKGGALGRELPELKSLE